MSRSSIVSIFWSCCYSYSAERRGNGIAVLIFFFMCCFDMLFMKAYQLQNCNICHVSAALFTSIRVKSALIFWFCSYILEWREKEWHFFDSLAAIACFSEVYQQINKSIWVGISTVSGSKPCVSSGSVVQCTCREVARWFHVCSEPSVTVSSILHYPISQANKVYQIKASTSSGCVRVKSCVNPLALLPHLQRGSKMCCISVSRWGAGDDLLLLNAQTRCTCVRER